MKEQYILQQFNADGDVAFTSTWNTGTIRLVMIPMVTTYLMTPTVKLGYDDGLNVDE